MSRGCWASTACRSCSCTSKWRDKSGSGASRWAVAHGGRRGASPSACALLRQCRVCGREEICQAPLDGPLVKLFEEFAIPFSDGLTLGMIHDIVTVDL